MCIIDRSRSGHDYYMWLDLGKPAMYAQELKSILFLNIIAMLQPLSRHSDKFAVVRRSVYTDGFLLTLSSHTGPIQTLWGYWEALLKWPVVPNCSTWCLLALWYICSGLLWLSVWPTVHTALLAVSNGIANLPTYHLHPSHPPTHLLICSTCDIASCVWNKHLSNQPVHQVAI